MNLHIIASGSKANCYILSAGEDGKDKLVLDAGVRFSALQHALDYDYSGVSGCLLTHEHMDHARCALQIENVCIPVMTRYATKTMIRGEDYSGEDVPEPRESAINLDNWTIKAFSTQHDAVAPVGFLVQYRQTGEALVYATDTYYIKQQFPGTTYYLVECNYCTDRLMEQYGSGEIDAGLYKRLLTSHMSLENLKKYFTKAPPKGARKIVLCHLSDARSDEARMVREISELTGVETVAARDGLTVELEQYPF